MNFDPMTNELIQLTAEISGALDSFEKHSAEAIVTRLEATCAEIVKQYAVKHPDLKASDLAQINQLVRKVAVEASKTVTAYIGIHERIHGLKVDTAPYTIANRGIEAFEQTVKQYWEDV